LDYLWVTNLERHEIATIGYFKELFRLTPETTEATERREQPTFRQRSEPWTLQYAVEFLPFRDIGFSVFFHRAGMLYQSDEKNDVWES
jgi:hypothetical protein